MAIDESVVKGLRAQMAGDVLAPGDGGYEETGGTFAARSPAIGETWRLIPCGGVTAWLGSRCRPSPSEG